MLSDANAIRPARPYMEGGERSDMPYINFYLDYFAQGRPAFVPVEYMDYRDAVELVRDNGGVPVVAHPGLNFRGREETAGRLLDRGAAGLEVFNNYHTPEQAVYFTSLALSKGASMTCGSDFHGKTKPLIGIGQFRFDDRFESYLRASAAGFRCFRKVAAALLSWLCCGSAHAPVSFAVPASGAIPPAPLPDSIPGSVGCGRSARHVCPPPCATCCRPYKCLYHSSDADELPAVGQHCGQNGSQYSAA